MIIGISGKMQVGKTTTADILAALTCGRRISFADALRDEVADRFALSEYWLRDGRAKQEIKVAVGYKLLTLRELLQWWGEEKRLGNLNYWVDKLLDNVLDNEIVFVDDVRYRNEADAIKVRGGLLLRIEPYKGYRTQPGANHRSETDLDRYANWDFVAHPGYGELGSLAREVIRTFALG